MRLTINKIKEMKVLNQDVSIKNMEISNLRSASARTRHLMVSTAIEVMQKGMTPSVSELGKIAGVSRATAYRYFPGQSDLVAAVVRRMLGPILSWTNDSDDVEVRIVDLLRTAFPRLEAFEATGRAALRHALDPRESDAGLHEAEGVHFSRGHRVALLNKALEPLDGKLSDASRTRLLHGLTLVFGIETQIVLKDICGLKGEEAWEVAIWSAKALLCTAMKEVKS